jgi:hypothetical protein
MTFHSVLAAIARLSQEGSHQETVNNLRNILREQKHLKKAAQSANAER